ncbi:MoaD/ThiS family protein [Candidatus Sumerlaeota bacterium]|nr:MoaD/ThiS family protein [Candidatus Sumerlaeota bacterium]
MPITVRIPQPLQKLTKGQAEVAAKGATAKEIIGHLERQFSGIGERLLDENGKLRRFVNIYLNDEDIRFLKNLDTPIKEGDKISIVPAIAGGVTIGDPKNLHQKFYLTFPQTLIKRPVLWELVKKFDVIPNIRTASVSNEIGLVALELEGAADQIESARAWLEQMNVTVEPVEKNVIE